MECMFVPPPSPNKLSHFLTQALCGAQKFIYWNYNNNKKHESEIKSRKLNITEHETAKDADGRKTELW